MTGSIGSHILEPAKTFGRAAVCLVSVMQGELCDDRLVSFVAFPFPVHAPVRQQVHTNSSCVQAAGTMPT